MQDGESLGCLIDTLRVPGYLAKGEQRLASDEERRSFHALATQQCCQVLRSAVPVQASLVVGGALCDVALLQTGGADRAPLDLAVDQSEDVLTHERPHKLQ